MSVNLNKEKIGENKETDVFSDENFENVNDDDLEVRLTEKVSDDKKIPNKIDIVKIIVLVISIILLISSIIYLKDLIEDNSKLLLLHMLLHTCIFCFILRYFQSLK